MPVTFTKEERSALMAVYRVTQSQSHDDSNRLDRDWLRTNTKLVQAALKKLTSPEAITEAGVPVVAQVAPAPAMVEAPIPPAGSGAIKTSDFKKSDDKKGRHASQSPVTAVSVVDKGSES